MIEVKTTHQTEALARLPEYNKDKPNIEALLNASVAESNRSDAAFVALYSKLFIDLATGVSLDVLGRVVGQPRGNSADDAEYRLRLRARIVANRSNGTNADILAVFAALLGGVSDVRLEAQPPAAFLVTVANGVIDSADLALLYASFVRDAKAAGVRAQLLYSAYPDAETFTLARSGVTSVDFEEVSPGVFGDELQLYDASNMPDFGSFLLDYGEATETLFTYTNKSGDALQGVEYVSGSGTAFGADSLIVTGPNADQALSDTVSIFGGKLASIIEVG